MKRGKVIGIFICVLVLGVTGLYFINRDKEPSYQGKRLSEWLALEGPRGARRLKAGDGPATAAVMHIGTNALPVLLRWIEYERPVWKLKMMELGRKLPGRFRYRIIDLIDGRPAMNRERAIYGFQILGPEARAAQQMLVRMREDSKRPQTAEAAGICLACIHADDLIPGPPQNGMMLELQQAVQRQVLSNSLPSNSGVQRRAVAEKQGTESK